MSAINRAEVGFWRKRAVRQALRRREDRLPYNFWNGLKLTKFPGDCFAIHALLSRCRPQVVLELGTQYGGSAAFIASFAAAAGIQDIISIDIEELERPVIPGVTWIVGDDTSDAVVRRVRELVGSRTLSLVIDANHEGPHVAKELDIYGKMITPGQALVLEDTHVDVLNFRKFRAQGGPLVAMENWLPAHPDFHLVEDIEPYITTNFFGYWQRVAGARAGK